MKRKVTCVVAAVCATLSISTIAYADIESNPGAIKTTVTSLSVPLYDSGPIEPTDAELQSE